MFSSKFRFGLIALLCISGVVVLTTGMSWKAAVLLFSTALLLLVGHFRYGTVLGGLIALRRGDVPKAEEMLLSIKRPQWLTARYRSLYHFALGLVCFYKKDFEVGDIHLLKSIELGLKGKNELGIAYLNLASSAYGRRDALKSTEYLEQAKAQGVDDLFFKQRIEELETALNRLVAKS